jgi:hypothetical protein
VLTAQVTDLELLGGVASRAAVLALAATATKEEAPGSWRRPSTCSPGST